MSDKTDLIKVLSSPVAYYAIFAKIGGGVTAGVFLSQLVYWTGKGKQADGWVWKSAEDMEDETGLTRNEQETARRNLKARGLITERLAGVPATLHFRVDLEAVLMAVAQFGENDQSSLAKTSKPVLGKTTNLLGENLQTIHRLPETTTETTTDVGARQPAAGSPSESAPTSRGKRDGKPPPAEGSSGLRDLTPPVDLAPQSDEERALFRLAAINTAPGRHPPRAQFQNAQQAQDFRAAVQVLNGETRAVLEAFYRGGGGGIGKAVAYVCGAARKRQATPPLEAEYQPPMFFAPTSWEEA